MASFSFLCNPIAHSIQNCLIYLPAKSAKLPEPELLANFKDYSKKEITFLYSLADVFLHTYYYYYYYGEAEVHTAEYCSVASIQI